ncbi:hypothetical protein BT96DRAFT_1000202 [Gymnopus androsaceus JB14]|uniref:Uncharacterized protein n=1 Tax=Gymnopus androsaceus JB14 TaxID=1447944 RepID=A0A6A4H3A7_9AGAR|nr:hypothetical protein BT96DRAFT_1000202 [Gymnopus androsaceus JB14]
MSSPLPPITPPAPGPPLSIDPPCRSIQEEEKFLWETFHTGTSEIPMAIEQPSYSSLVVIPTLPKATTRPWVTL